MTASAFAAFVWLCVIFLLNDVILVRQLSFLLLGRPSSLR